MKMLSANIILVIIYASVGHSTSQCEDKCPVYRLDSVGLPVPSTAYWWPGSGDIQLSYFQSDRQVAFTLSEGFRNQWHEVQLYHYNLTDGLLPSGSIILSSPSIERTFIIKCDGRKCSNLQIFTPKSVWALDCPGVPCGCPSDRGNCKYQIVPNTECTEVNLYSLEVPLDSSSKIFWLPVKRGSLLLLRFDVTSKFLRLYNDSVKTWISIEINAKDASPESPQDLSCITIHGWLYHECSSKAKVLSLESDFLEVFALGCQDGPRREIAQGVSAAVIAAAVIAALFIALFVVRTMRCRKRTASAETGE